MMSAEEYASLLKKRSAGEVHRSPLKDRTHPMSTLKPKQPQPTMHQLMTGGKGIKGDHRRTAVQSRRTKKSAKKSGFLRNSRVWSGTPMKQKVNAAKLKQTKGVTAKMRPVPFNRNNALASHGSHHKARTDPLFAQAVHEAADQRNSAAATQSALSPKECMVVIKTQMVLQNAKPFGTIRRVGHWILARTKKQENPINWKAGGTFRKEFLEKTTKRKPGLKLSGITLMGLTRPQLQVLRKDFSKLSMQQFTRMTNVLNIGRERLKSTNTAAECAKFEVAIIKQAMAMTAEDLIHGKMDEDQWEYVLFEQKKSHDIFRFIFKIMVYWGFWSIQSRRS